MTYRLISWGANSHGQLGQGIVSEECLLPREVELSSSCLNCSKIKKIVGGAGHSLILDTDGRVFSCGWNNKGQAGFSGNADILLFRELAGELKGKVVIDVACGWDSSAALTTEGTLFLWGSNRFGQLGKHPTTLRDTHKPFRITINRKIERVSMGLRHTALLTEDRKVLITGSGNKGQLGLGTSKEGIPNATYTFTEVPALKNVVDIVCGQHHTIAMTMERSLYVFGDNKHGQLGLNPELCSKISFPARLTEVQFDVTIKMCTGWSHSIILTDGNLFSWGRNTYGQLGNPESQRPDPWKISRIPNLPRISQISLGSEHNVALSDDGKIFCWGWNEHGNCGNGNTGDVILPERLPISYIDGSAILIGCGAGHSFAVVKTP